MLAGIGLKAGINAARDLLQKGIPIVFSDGTHGWRLLPDGHREIRQKRRWPEFPEWDEKASAMEALAAACGAHAYCSQKYRYLNIELRRGTATQEQYYALHEIADLIEMLTDQD